MHEIATYRQPRGNWICMGACALVLSGVVVLAGVAIVLEGLDLVTLLLTVFVVCLSAYADWIALEMARTRIDVGYDWIEKRAPFRRPRRVAFAEITAFSERRGLLRLGAHVSEFRVFTASGPPLTFTSQFVGWAAIVEALHQSVPWRVPPASTLLARRLRHWRRVDPFSAASAAPGQPIPEEWRSPARIRWRDALLAQVVCAVAVFFVVVKIEDAIEAATGSGYRPWHGFVAMLVIIAGAQVTTLFATSAIHRRRVARARRDRLVSLDDAERVISPTFAERQRRG